VSAGDIRQELTRLKHASLLVEGGCSMATDSLASDELRAERTRQTEPHRVVVVGGGFGGLNLTQSLKRSEVQVTLLDRRNFQVATGALSPGDISSPLRQVLRGQLNARVWMAEVTGFDVSQRRVLLTDGELPYDTLVVAAGARHHYFGHDEWEPLAPGLKSIEDSLEIRRRVLTAFEAAEREPDPDARAALLTFVIVGAGPTGVELAGALAEIAHDTMRHDFRASDPRHARILLVEGCDRVLPAYPPQLSQKAGDALRKLGVTVRTGTLVEDLSSEHCVLRCGDGRERIATQVVLWAAGNTASPLTASLARETGAARDRSGRIMVGPDLTIAGHPEIFVIGDMAHASHHETGAPLPGVAPVAIQQGQYVARMIRERLDKKNRPRPFRYRDLGSMATIGRGSAVADLGWLQFSGYSAWLAWLFIHLMALVEFENRVLVLVQWGWNYVTWNRGARLITDMGRALGSVRAARS
jgi:NADH dehydrogenase